MNCKFCSQSDESRLVLSSRLVNGTVIHEWVCFSCLWRDEFVHENGNHIQSKEKICRNRERNIQQAGASLLSQRHSPEGIRYQGSGKGDKAL